MPPHLNSQLNMPTAPASSFSGSPTVNNSPSNNYSPSVPISVYRELAAELSSTRTQMQTYKFQNQQLVEQNQKLRLEIERVVQSALHLRQIADAQGASYSGTHYPGSDHSGPDQSSLDYPMPPLANPKPAAAASRQRPIPLKRSASEAPERLVTEQQEPQPRRSSANSRAASGINGGWLMVIIAAIVITAFGTGFLIVRPLLPTR
jgi:hypothetical protein